MNRSSETYAIPSCVSIYIVQVLEGEENKKETQRIFQEIVAPKSPNLMKNINLYN